jgi:hypothetical protein
MKTIRLFGVALLTVLLSVGFSSCSKSDDDNGNGGGGGTSTSIEGKWYLKSEKWYGWKNGQPDMSTVTIDKTYDDYADKTIWTFKKSGDDLILTETHNGKTNEYNLIINGNNDYKMGKYDRFVIKSVTPNSLVVDLYDHYYGEGDDTTKEYGVITFMR